MDKWEEKYAGYVVRDKTFISANYVGPNSEQWRVALRSMAVRFTKADALKYVEAQDKPDDFVIEDAT